MEWLAEWKNTLWKNKSKDVTLLAHDYSSKSIIVKLAFGELIIVVI